MTSKYNNLFEPFKIGKLEIKNKFVMAPMGPGGLSNEDGAFNEKGVEYYGAGKRWDRLITGICYVENEVEKKGYTIMPCPTLNPASFIKTAAQMTERVHAYDSRSSCSLQVSGGNPCSA